MSESVGPENDATSEVGPRDPDRVDDAPTESPAPFTVGQRTLSLPGAGGVAVLQDPVSGPRFRARRMLGRGGMGEVWLAEDLDLGREVAVKTLRKLHGSAVVRFIREARLNGQLEHPNIVPVHDLLVERGKRAMPYIVMKRVRGLSLSELLSSLGEGRVVSLFEDGSSEVGPASSPGGSSEAGGPRRALRLGADPRGDLSRLLGIFLKICDGVAYAHARGVIHRDLKPGNIMLGEFGEVLVMDWGLAKQLGEDDLPSPQYRQASESTETVDGAVLGTPAYMAPEQARGENAAVDKRADIYALGAVLYQILTLRLPYEGPRETLLARVGCGVLDPPSERAPDRWIPAELEGIVLRAMAPRPAERYARAQDLAEDVQRFLAGRMVSAHRYSWWQRAGKWWARHKQAVALVSLIAVLLGGAAFAVLAADKRARQRLEEQQARELAGHTEAARVQLEGYQAQLDGLAASMVGRTQVEECSAFADQIGESTAPLVQDDQLREHAPELVAWAKDLPAQAVVVREASLRSWALRELAQLEAVPDETAAAATFGLFVPFISEELPRRDLPVAAFALHVVRATLARGDAARAYRWAAEAYCAQPHSAAAGRCFLLLAEASLAAGDFRRASSQFLLALQAFAAQPALRPHAWLGLAQALTGLPADAAPPFAPDRGARELALRCLLEVMEPDGALLPEAAGLQDASFVRRAQQLRALLRRASFSALDASWEGWRLLQWDEAPPGMMVRLQGACLEVMQALAPEQAGAGPARWQQVETRDFASLLRAVDPDCEGRFGAFVQLCSFEPGTLGLLWLASDGRTLWGVRSLAEAQPSLMLELPERLKRLCVGDLNADGLLDLISAHYRDRESIFLMFGQADGSFSAPQALPRSVEFKPGTVRELLYRLGPSVPYGLELADLDGDGSAELAVGYGEWSQYGLHIYQPTAQNGARVYDHRWLGRTAVGLVPGGRNSQLLLTRNPLDESDWAFFEQNGWPRRPDLPRLWSFDGQQLHELEQRGESLPPDVSSAGAGSFEEAGQHALVVWGEERSYVRFYPTPDWGGHLLGQLQCGGAGLLPREDGLTLAHSSSAGALQRPEPHGVFRLASASDLAELAAQPLILPDLQRYGSEGLAQVRFLAEFGLPAEAARVAARLLERADQPWETRQALLRAEILGWSSAEQDEALEALLLRARPASELVGDCVDAVEALARRRRNPALVRRVLQRWLRALGPDTPGTELLRTRLRAWPADEDVAQIDWQGSQVRTAGQVVGLEELLVCGDAWAYLPGEQGQAGHVHCRAVPERLVPRGAGLEIRPSDGFAGVPIQLDSKGWRVLTDIRLTNAPWSSELNFGLLPLLPLAQGQLARPVSGFNIRVRGGNMVHRTELHALQGETWLRGPSLDALEGRWLRIEVAYLPSLQELWLSVSDLDAGTLVFATEGPCAGLEGRNFLLGFAPDESAEQLCAELGRVTLFGEARLLSERHPLVEAVYQRLPHVRAYSASVRARLAGQSDQAAQALQPLRDALSAAEVRPGWEGALETQQAFVALDQVWSESRDSEDALARRLGSLLALGIDGAQMVSWQQQAASAELPAVFWHGVGRALAAQIAPDVSLLELVRQLEARIDSGDASGTELALALWLERLPPGTPGLSRRLLTRLYSTSDDFPLVNFAAQRLIRGFERDQTGALAAPPNTRLATALALFAAGRREEMLQLLEGLEPPEGLRAMIELQRFVQSRRLDELEAAQKEAHARSLMVPRPR